MPKQVCHFSSLSIFCLRLKTISRRTARRQIVLHLIQNIESELKWKNLFWNSAKQALAVPIVRQGKGCAAVFKQYMFTSSAANKTVTYPLQISFIFNMNLF